MYILLFYISERKKDNYQPSCDTVFILMTWGAYGSLQPLKFLSSLTREAVPPASAFTAWHLTAILLFCLLTKHAQLHLLMSFFLPQRPGSSQWQHYRKIGHCGPLSTRHAGFADNQFGTPPLCGCFVYTVTCFNADCPRALWKTFLMVSQFHTRNNTSKHSLIEMVAI